MLYSESCSCSHSNGILKLAVISRFSMKAVKWERERAASTSVGEAVYCNTQIVDSVLQYEQPGE